MFYCYNEPEFLIKLKGTLSGDDAHFRTESYYK